MTLMVTTAPKIVGVGAQGLSPVQKSHIIQHSPGMESGELDGYSAPKDVWGRGEACFARVKSHLLHRTLEMAVSGKMGLFLSKIALHQGVSSGGSLFSNQANHTCQTSTSTPPPLKHQRDELHGTPL
ncbi:MAG: hypothetical protein DWQ07_04765 [Chloroflexi bacterium]|nr:MAG: hypothetical protein DWQ07_04765 [Chloroflexota bacterium]MBL1194743.1 hypothetical protein [Chloroflexota bacterium]